MVKDKRIDQFWVFDTEDNSQGKVYWVDFFNGVQHYSFDNSDRALEWIMQQEGEFWACNLEYDLINLFGPLLEPLSVLTYGGFGLLKASIYGKPVHFRNTLRHWPMSVEEMGERLGYPKLPFDPTNLLYCQRDTEVTWRFISAMFERYYELGVQEIKATLPSTSLAFFTEQWCKVNWQRHGDLGVWKFLAQSRYGGRCEIFQTGPIKGHVHEYDINSSYPSSMKHCMFPNLDTMRRGKTVSDFDKGGVASCLVECPPMEFPLLPYKDEERGKLLFPYGTFAGTWTYAEIKKAIQLNYKILEIYDTIEYELMPSPFAPYIDFLYNKRMEVKKTDELMSYTLKIFMNALFGKWGEEGELQVISRGKRYTMNQVPKHSNMVWASYVLSYGRIALYDYIQQASQFGTVLYCDTDSVFVKTHSSEKPFEGSSDLGKLGYKHSYRLAHFKLPKLYQVDNSYKAKGVPNDKKHEFPEHLKKSFFDGEVADFLKPYRWMESKRVHEQANVWHTVTKQVQSSYDKRSTLLNGRTFPLKVTENLVYNQDTKPKRKRILKPIGELHS